MTSKLLWQDELNPRVRCAFGNVLDSSPIIYCIGYPCQWLTHCCLEDLADVTLAFEDANSKRLAVADVDAEERVDDNLVKF